MPGAPEDRNLVFPAELTARDEETEHIEKSCSGRFVRHVEVGLDPVCSYVCDRLRALGPDPSQVLRLSVRKKVIRAMQCICEQCRVWSFQLIHCALGTREVCADPMHFGTGHVYVSALHHRNELQVCSFAH